jgi:endonuclease/exonuclease/phosphatase family metal-dependent hydrolase
MRLARTLGSVSPGGTMTPSHAGPPRGRSLLAVVAVLAATLSACVAVASGNPQFTVMTRNLYLGTGLNDTLGASSWPQLVAAGSHDWANVLTNDFPTRAGALAEEIEQARPDVVGLQEVTLWRDQTPSDVATHPSPDATHVAYDFLAILLGALRARGSPYTSVATSTNADIEVPRRGAGGDLVDLRVTDRDALLVRTDVAGRSSNPRHGHYAAQVSEALVPGPVDSPRGWVTIDYRPDPRTTVRIFSTHLEVGDPAGRTIQEQQGEEALAEMAASPYPVIALGDFNSPADGSGTDTYRNLTAVRQDAWAAARPADPGWTCCQGELLDDPVGRERSRIDLVLTPENWQVLQAARTGDQPFRTAPPPLWASDHTGVTARILIPRR